MESRGGEYASMYMDVWVRFEWTDGTMMACERERQDNSPSLQSAAHEDDLILSWLRMTKVRDTTWREYSGGATSGKKA